MAGWGSPWGGGNPWGVLSGPTYAAFCELAEDRALVQMDDTPGNRRFLDMLCVLGHGPGHFVDVAEDVAEGFNLESAVGQQLDKIGSAVRLPRSGFGDDFYRVILKIQATILRGQTAGNWTGTVNDLLGIVRTFIGPTLNPIVYVSLPPYSFKLTIPKALTPEEFKVLFRFIRQALYAGVLGQVQIIPEGDNLYQSSGGGVVQGGVYGNAGGAQNPGIVPAIYSYIITT
jgi:hypothetical protein